MTTDLLLGRQILPLGLSDHSPVMLALGSCGGDQRPIWRLNAWQMTSDETTQYLQAKIQSYFECNEDSVDSTGRAGKAYVRGIARSHIRAQDQRHFQKITDLEAMISTLE